jgi:hypothetical protein
VPSQRTTTRRRLEVFALQGHQNRRVIDYGALFNLLAAIQPADRARQFGTTLVALPKLEVAERRVKFIAYEGPTDEALLIYNRIRAEERIQRLASGDVSAHKTHALLSLQTREMIVEYNYRGPKASDIVSLCQDLARNNRDWASLDLTVTPVVEASFLQALDRFRVIKLATVKVARPNPGWTDDFRNLMAEMADDSDARIADVTLARFAKWIAFEDPRTGRLSSGNAFRSGTLGRRCDNFGHSRG